MCWAIQPPKSFRKRCDPIPLSIMYAYACKICGVKTLGLSWKRKVHSVRCRCLAKSLNRKSSLPLHISIWFMTWWAPSLYLQINLMNGWLDVCVGDALMITKYGFIGSMLWFWWTKILRRMSLEFLSIIRQVLSVCCADCVDMLKSMSCFRSHPIHISGWLMP